MFAKSLISSLRSILSASACSMLRIARSRSLDLILLFWFDPICLYVYMSKITCDSCIVSIICTYFFNIDNFSGVTPTSTDCSLSSGSVTSNLAMPLVDAVSALSVSLLLLTNKSSFGNLPNSASFFSFKLSFLRPAHWI